MTSCRRMPRAILAVVLLVGCHNPTNPDDVVDFDEVVDVTFSPDPDHCGYGNVWPHLQDGAGQQSA